MGFILEIDLDKIITRVEKTEGKYNNEDISYLDLTYDVQLLNSIIDTQIKSYLLSYYTNGKKKTFQKTSCMYGLFPQHLVY